MHSLEWKNDNEESFKIVIAIIMYKCKCKDFEQRFQVLMHIVVLSKFFKIDR